MFSRWDATRKRSIAAISRITYRTTISILYSDSVDYLIAHPKSIRSDWLEWAYARAAPIRSWSIVSGRKSREYRCLWRRSDRRISSQAAAAQRPYEDIVGRVTAPVIGIWGEERLRHLDRRCPQSYATFSKRIARATSSSVPRHARRLVNDTMPGRYRPRETAMVWETDPGLHRARPRRRLSQDRMI